MQFHANFRMCRSTYEQLLQLIAPSLPQQFKGFGQCIIPPEERLAMVLWFVSSSETYRQLAARFGTTDSVVSLINACSITITNVCHKLTIIRFSEKYVKQYCVSAGCPSKCVRLVI